MDEGRTSLAGFHRPGTLAADDRTGVRGSLRLGRAGTDPRDADGCIDLVPLVHGPSRRRVRQLPSRILGASVQATVKPLLSAAPGRAPALHPVMGIAEH